MTKILIQNLNNIECAYDLHIKAKNIGFYWTSVHQILDNIGSEVTEIKQAIEQQESQARISEEIGDLYLGLLELCHYLNLDPETVLQNSLKKFEKRLNFVKDRMQKRGIDYFDDNSKDIALKLWHEAKAHGAVEED
ncbi:MAG: MazG nucleotide pyrophosphohydrolase domain-containing protein [Janthinobacterium lividum]